MAREEAGGEGTATAVTAAPGTVCTIWVRPRSGRTDGRRRRRGGPPHRRRCDRFAAGPFYRTRFRGQRSPLSRFPRPRLLLAPSLRDSPRARVLGPACRCAAALARFDVGSDKALTPGYGYGIASRFLRPLRLGPACRCAAALVGDGVGLTSRFLRPRRPHPARRVAATLFGDGSARTRGSYDLVASAPLAAARPRSAATGLASRLMRPRRPRPRRPRPARRFAAARSRDDLRVAGARRVGTTT